VTPFALTETLLPHLPDGVNVGFAASAVEDPERKPVKMAPPSLTSATYLVPQRGFIQ
jgi:hypothetical protein